MSYKYFNEIEDTEMIGVNNILMEMLDKAREIAGVPFIITSGVRTEKENFEAGGVLNSSHLTGLAIDLRCFDSSTRYKILKGLFFAGFRRIEITSRHIHADIDESKDQELCWLK